MFNHFYLAGLVFLIGISVIFLLVKKNKHLQKLSIDLDIGGIIYGGIVAVYSILLAFIVVIVWQQYQNTGDRIQEESSKVFNLYRASYAFPDSTTGKKIRDRWEVLNKPVTDAPAYKSTGFSIGYKLNITDNAMLRFETRYFGSPYGLWALRNGTDVSNELWLTLGLTARLR